MNKLW
jgi:hypothetical protein